MYPENKAIQEILSIRERFNARKVSSWTGEELSRIAVRLLTLNSYLGELVAEATFEANSKYSYRKFKYAKDYKSIRQDIDMKVKDADIEAMIKSEESQKEEIEAQYQADLLKTLYEDVKALVMSLQTRIGYLKSEMISSNTTDNVTNN